MMKTIKLIILLLSGFTLWSQSIENSNGDVVDADFEQCVGVGFGTLGIYYACAYLEDFPTCTGWDFESGYSALICTQNLLLGNGDFGSAAYSERGHALLVKKVENNLTVVDGKLKAILADLTPGQSYRLVFHQVNMGVPYGEAEGLDTGYVVTIGEETFFEPAVPYIAEFIHEYHWFESTITFCATEESMPLTIGSEILNSGSDSSCYLAIDDIKIEGNPEGELCEIPCVNCNSFELVRGKDYFITGWVKQTNSTYVNVKVPSYSNSFIRVGFYDSFENELPASETEFTPAGEIIDGWQKMSGIFTVPANAGEINIGLINATINRAFFDDIRVHPIDSNLKSFVYDQGSQKLMAELDENNYATFYEYDKEGGLVRVKKETEKGVFTIQETRSSNRKKEGE